MVFTFRHQKLTDIGSEAGSFCSGTDENGMLVLKEDHKYWFQVQGQMAVTGRHWVDFVVYT